MQTFKEWWNLLYSHRSEAAWGLFWAVVFWFIADLTSVDSVIQAGQLFGLMFLTLGGAIAVQGVRLTSLETAAKVQELLDKLDEELMALRIKLDARLAKG